MEINWVPIVKSKASVLFQWFVFEGHKKKYFKNSLNIETSLENGKIVSDEIFIDTIEWEKFEKDLRSIVAENEIFLEDFILKCYKKSKNLLKTSKELSKHELKNNNPLKSYKKYQNSVFELVPFMNATLAIDNILKEKIIRKLEKVHNISDQKEQEVLLSKLIVPKKKSFFVRENENLIKLALKKVKGKDIEKDIEKHLDKFAWTTSIAYLGDFQTKEVIKEKIKELLKENLKQKIKQGKEVRKERSADYNKALKRIKHSKSLVKLVDIAQEFLYLQNYRLDAFFYAHYLAFPFLEKPVWRR